MYDLIRNKIPIDHLRDRKEARIHMDESEE